VGRDAGGSRDWRADPVRERGILSKTRTDSAFREIAASPRKLYQAFVDAGSVAAWLPPEGMTGRFDAFEPRAGGAYRMTLTYADAEDAPGKSSDDSDVVEGVFVELVPDARIVQRAEFQSDDPALAGAMTITWRLDPVDAGTRVTVTCEDVPVAIPRKDHLAGLRSTLENLAAFVE
jgi:uncharacterized protein YndB with AHSA1/START domain